MAEASTRWTTEQSGCTQPKGSQDEGASTGRPSTVSARPFKCWFTRATNYQERTTASCTCYGSASASSYPTSSCLRSCPRETTTRRKHLRMGECPLTRSQLHSNRLSRWDDRKRDPVWACGQTARVKATARTTDRDLWQPPSR